MEDADPEERNPELQFLLVAFFPAAKPPSNLRFSSFYTLSHKKGMKVTSLSCGGGCRTRTCKGFPPVDFKSTALPIRTNPPTAPIVSGQAGQVRGHIVAKSGKGTT